MATPRGAEHRDLEQRFRDLERKYDALASRVLMQRKAEVTQGDFVVKGGGNIVILGPAGNTLWSALDGPIKVVSHAQSLDSPGLTSSWAEYLTYAVPVPDGFTSCVVNLFTSTGATAAVGGTINVGTRPVINGGALAGPGLSVGSATSSPASVTSAWTWNGAIPSGGLNVGMQAYLQGGITAGTDNVHLTCTVLLLR